MMDSSIINLIQWVPTILCGVILLWQLLAGMRRGFSKSVKLFITFLLSIGVAVGFYLAINNNFDSTVVNLTNTVLQKAGISNPSNFTDIVNSLFKEQYGACTDHDTLSGYIQEILSKTEYFAENSKGLSLEEATKLLYSFSMLIVHLAILIVCVVVYFLAKFIFYISYMIFAREGRKKRKIKKKIKKYNEAQAKLPEEERKPCTIKPYKKKRLLGLVVGLIRGAIVALFVASIFGTISILIPSDKDNTITDDSKVNNDTKAYIDVYNAVCKWNTVGVTGILNNLKNEENLPYYLILANKIMSSEYTYEENGETKTITLSLNSDLSPLTKSLSKCAYLFLMYGYDINKQYTQEELSDFIASDTTIDGLTLQDRIDSILQEANFGEYTNYLIDGVVRTYVSYTCKNVDSTDSEEYQNLELTNKILYLLFLGDNSIKSSELIQSTNLRAAYNTYVTILKHQDEINAISKLFDTKSETSLAYGIKKTTTKEDTNASLGVFTEINDCLKEITFYKSDRFQRLVSDILVTSLNEQYKGLDFTSVVDEKDHIYDVKWTESLTDVFAVLDDVVDLVVNKEFASTDDLSDYIIKELGDKDSKTVTDIKKLINSNAGSVLLNSKAFNKIINDALSDALKESLPNTEITLIETNYASYIDSNGNTVKGELEKVLDSIGSVISGIYTISKDTTLSEDDKTDKLLKAITSNKNVKNLLDTASEDHSNLVHTLLSNIISNVSLDSSKEDDTLYVPESSYTDITVLSGQTCKVIDSSEFTNLLDFLGELTEKYSIKDFSDTDKYVDLIFDLSSYIKKSDIICSNIAVKMYEFKDSASLTIPTNLDLSADNKDKNLSNWLGETGEVNKLISVITFEYTDKDGNKKNYKDMISSLIDGNGDINSLLPKIFNSIDNYGDTLFSSNVINATITKTLDDQDKIFVPTSSYLTSETIKISELKSICNFAKIALGVTEDTESVDLDNLSTINLGEYSTDDKLDSLLEIFDSNIVSATLAYNIVDISKTSEDITVRDSYKFTAEDQTNLSKWLSSTDDIGETKRIVTAIHRLGLLNNIGSNLEVNEVTLLNLSDEKKTDIFESDVINSTITTTLKKTDQIFIPSSSYDASGEKIDTQELVGFCNFAKAALGVKEDSDSVDFSDLSNIDLSDYSADDKLNSLLALFDTKLVSATLAYNIVDIDNDSITVRNSYKFTKDNQTNLSKWLSSTDDIGETKKIVTAIHRLGLLGSIGSDLEVNEVTLLNLSDSKKTDIFSSDVINSTITTTLKKTDQIYIPSSSYEVSGEKIDTQELVGFCNFAKAALNVDEKTDSVDFSDLSTIKLGNYSTDEQLDSLLELFDCNIVSATLAYNIVDASNGKDSSIVVRSSYKFSKTDETNLSKWTGDGETKKIVKAIHRLGLLDNIGANLEVDEAKMLNLSDSKKTDIFDSDVINSTVTKTLKDTDEIYIPSSSYEVAGEKIKTLELVAFCDFAKEALGVKEDDTTVDFSKLSNINLGSYSADDQLDNLLALFDSNIVSATLAYNVVEVSNETDSSLVVRASYKFDKDNETNLSMWLSSKNDLGETKRIVKAMHRLGLLGSIGSGLEVDNAKMLKLSDEKKTDIFSSDVINASVTKTLNDNDSVFVPYNSFEVKDKLIKTQELVDFCNFAKEALGVDDNTPTVDFNKLNNISLSKYNNDLTGLLALFDCDMVSATLANNLITTSADSKSTLVVPNSFVFTKDNQTNLSKWLGESGETKKLVTSIYHLGLLDGIDGASLGINEDELLTLSYDTIDEVFKSDVFNATGDLYYTNSSPDSLASKKEYKADKSTIQAKYETLEIAQNQEIAKLLKAVKSLNIKLATASIDVQLINKMNDVDSTTNKASIDYIIDSDILYYALSDYIIKSDDLKVSQTIKTTGTYIYIKSDELKLFVTGIIALKLSDKLSEFDANKLLTSDTKTLLASNIIWYTLSYKLLELGNIEILSDSIDSNYLTNYEEIFVDTNEVNNFITAVKAVTTDIKNISVEASTLIQNVTVFNDSNIIRRSITKEILAKNDIAYRITEKTTHTVTTLANCLEKYNQSGSTNESYYTLTKDEVSKFVNSINIIFGDNATYDIKYEDIELSKLSDAALDSSIILVGLHDKVDKLITTYNTNAALNNTNKFDSTLYDNYYFDLAHYDSNNKVISTTTNKVIHTKKCIVAFKAVMPSTSSQSTSSGSNNN